VTPDKTNAIYMAGANLALRDDSPDYPALTVGNRIFGGGFLNSRPELQRRLAVECRLPRSRRILLHLRHQRPPQNIGHLETDVREELDRALQTGFTPIEIAAAKSGLLEARKVSRASDGQLAADLTQHLYLGRTFTWDTQLEQRIAAATPAAVQVALRRFIDPSHFVTIKAGDFANSGKLPQGANCGVRLFH
jgi:zinc protease